MNKLMLNFFRVALLLMLVFFQATSVQALSDDHIQREIETKFIESTMLRDAQIKIHVDQRLVLLSGTVRLFEQKLVSSRLAWTTKGVFEVTNEIRVMPKIPLADKAIERKVREIIKTYSRFHGADIMVSVDNGVVSVHASFSGVGDPVFLKHQVAKIEGVINVKINATFLTLLNATV